MKLGKNGARVANAVKLSRAASLFPTNIVPRRISWNNNIPWTMLANDDVGDCTCAGVMHAIQTVERWRNGVSFIPTDSQTLAAYSGITGYTPGKPETDTGAIIADVLAYWKNTGFETPTGLNKITGYSHVDNAAHIRLALWALGPLIIGAQLPLQAQNQDVWGDPRNTDGDNAVGSWGGHCVILTDLDENDNGTVITWGAPKVATKKWISTYVDEIWAPIQPLWLEDGFAPSGELASAILAEFK